jgi:hypothetical protein
MTHIFKFPAKENKIRKEQFFRKQIKETLCPLYPRQYGYVFNNLNQFGLAKLDY